MYADVYRDSVYVDTIDLFTIHGLNHSTFTFDYSPIYFGNYSFEFYLADPYLPEPQLICNATFNYEDPDPDPDPEPDPDYFFTYSIIKNESWIKINIAGSHIFISGAKPIFNGSMYANVYHDSVYVDVIDSITIHDLDFSTFAFDYSPIYFGNYSFEFYLIDPYLPNPWLICNATFAYRDSGNNNTNPNPDPDPDPDPDLDDDLNNLYQRDATITLPLALGMVGAATVPLLGTYKTLRSKKFKNKHPLKK